MDFERNDILSHGPISPTEIEFQNFLNLPAVRLLEKKVTNPPEERTPYRENYAHDVFEILRLYFGYIVPYEVISLTIFNSPYDKIGVDYSIRSLRRAGYFKTTELNTFKDFGVSLGVLSMPLEPMTYATLKLLWSNSGKKVKRDEIIRDVWGYEGDNFDDFAPRVQTCIFRLREHLLFNKSEFGVKTTYGDRGGYNYMLYKIKKEYEEDVE